MAIDWSREISFTGKRKAAASPDAGYPEKTYMNLVVSDRRSSEVTRLVPRVIVLVAVVVLVMKFGIFDFYARVDAKQAELAAQRQTLGSLTAQLEDYDTVLEEYEGYASVSISDEGLEVDALEALALVDRIVAPAARVASISLSGDTLALNVTGITLDGVGQLVNALNDQDLVEDVLVSTAATQTASSEDVAAALTITLVPRG